MFSLWYTEKHSLSASELALKCYNIVQQKRQRFTVISNCLCVEWVEECVSLEEKLILKLLLRLSELPHLSVVTVL